MSSVIMCLGLLFFLGHFFSWFFEKTKIPDLLLLILLGYFIGPIMGFVDPLDLGKVGSVLSTAALIIILYEGGINLSARDLLTSSFSSLGLTIFGFFSMAGITSAIVYFIAKQEWFTAVLLGVGVGSTSSAIVIPMLKSLSVNKHTKTILTLESAFTDVLAIVIFLVIVEGILSNHVSLKDIFLGIGPKTITSGLIGIICGLLWSLIRKKYAIFLPKNFSGEAWALLTYGFIETLEHNGAIGVLSLGFTLANLNFLPFRLKSYFNTVFVSTHEISLLSETTFLLRTFFFIYLGLLIKFASIRIILLALLISSTIFMTRYLAVRIVFRSKNFSRLDTMIATAMGPRGLACAVLATIPLQKGIQNGQWLQDVIFAVIPISIIFTSIFVSCSENKAIRKCFYFLFKSYSDEQHKIDESLINSSNVRL